MMCRLWVVEGEESSSLWFPAAPVVRDIIRNNGKLYYVKSRQWDVPSDSGIPTLNLQLEDQTIAQ